jgi:uncharacterized protein
MLLAVLLSVALLAWSGVANLVLGDTGYLPRNLVLTALLLALARAAGLRVADLGLARRDVGSGLRWGALAMAVVALGLTVAVALGDAAGPVTAMLQDERAQLAPGSLAWAALVRIPLGTALFEEVAFRGVLLAALLRITSTSGAVAWSSVVFGLWHVAPTMVALELNGVAPLSLGGLSAVAGGVIVTTVGGVVFALLRVRSGSLVAPILAHVATNSLALLAAAVSTS